MTATREELQNMYWGQLMNARQIAEKYGVVPGAVRYWMIKYGIPRRNHYEATLKYPRKPFSGDGYERAYLLGLRAGDIHARRRAANTIGVNVTTTRPAMFKLCKEVFAKYGYVKKYPVRGPLGPQWYVYSDLDKSFEFLIEKPTKVPTDESFYAFLAGYVDSEGTWTFNKQVNKLLFHFWIKSQDLDLLKQIEGKLKSNGFHLNALKLEIKGGRWQKVFSNGKTIWIKNRRDYWRLRLCRQTEIVLLAEKLIPFVRHEEKMKRMLLILKAKNREWLKYGEEIRNRIQQMNEGAKKWVEEAELGLKTREIYRVS